MPDELWTEVRDIVQETGDQDDPHGKERKKKCEVKWALESITTNKASGGDGIPVELFHILKDESAAINMQANLKNSALATGLKNVSFHSNPKEGQCQRMFRPLPNCTHLTRLQSNAQNSPSQASTVYEP